MQKPSRSVCWSGLIAGVVIAASSCTPGQDSLKNERAAMEQEAKALAERPVPSMSGSAPGPTRPGSATPLDADPAKGVKIPSGMELKIAPSQALSSRTAETGAEWRAKLLEDLKVDGVVLARAGAQAVGRFTLVSDGTRLRKKHELELRIHKIEAVGGNFVEVRTLSYIHEGEMQGRMPALIRADQPVTFRIASGVTFPR